MAKGNSKGGMALRQEESEEVVGRESVYTGVRDVLYPTGFSIEVAICGSDTHQ